MALWAVNYKTNEVHVVPLNDLIDHIEVEDKCACGPTLEVVMWPNRDVHMYTHHSLDGREKDE